MVAPSFIMCKHLPGGTGFEGMKGSWRTAEAYHCQRTKKDISAGPGSELKELWKEVKATLQESQNSQRNPRWAIGKGILEMPEP